MLDLACRHAQRLQERYHGALFQEKYKWFWNYPDVEYYIPIHNNLGDMLQFVSLNGRGDVIGYFGCRINRDTRSAYDLEMMSFAEDSVSDKMEFSHDLYGFLDRLFQQFGVNRMYWSVVVGNPVENLYDRLVTNYGGRIVGTFTKHARLYDGSLCDAKFYEIHKDAIYAGLEKAGVNFATYRRFNKQEVEQK